MKYYVTVQIEVEADNEHTAIKEALQAFDASAHHPEIV